MPSADAPSPADQELINHAASQGLTVTVKQLRVWRERGLLERNTVHGLGRGRGTVSVLPEGAREMVVWLGREARRGRRPTDLALRAFLDGAPVPERTVHAAFLAAVDDLVLYGESDAVTLPSESPQERAERIADRVAADKGIGAAVPTRARRLDAAVKELGLDLGAPELSRQDPGAGTSQPATPADLAVIASEVLLLGRAAIHNQGLGDVIRALSPRGAAAPLAYFIEHLDEDPEGPAVQDVDGVLTDGDLRNEMRAIASCAPLPLLRQAWQCADQLNNWANALYEAAELEASEGRLGPALIEWARSSLMPPLRLQLVRTLAPGPRSLTEQARTALGLTYVRNLMIRLDNQIAGLQWGLLSSLGVLPEPLQAFLVPDGAIGREAD